MKPLMLVNGEPLIVSLVRLARAHGQPTVVVAPENAVAVTDVLRAHDFDNAHIVVQPEANGPLVAVRRGLIGCRSEGDVALLMGDNVVSDYDFQGTVESRGDGATVCVRSETHTERARRFSRVLYNRAICEGEPIREDERWPDGMYRCWLGPVIAPYRVFEKAVLAPSADRLSRAISQMGPLRIFEGFCIDIGVPDAVQQ